MKLLRETVAAPGRSLNDSARTRMGNDAASNRKFQQRNHTTRRSLSCGSGEGMIDVPGILGRVKSPRQSDLAEKVE